MEMPKQVVKDPGGKGLLVKDKPKHEVFGNVSIERRTLVTKTETISIPNISRIYTRTLSLKGEEEPNPKRFWCSVGAVLAFAYGMKAYNEWNSYGASRWLGLVCFFAFLIAAGLAWYAVHIAKNKKEPDTKTYHLVVVSVDGALFQFSATTSDFIERVKRIITDRINDDDQNQVVQVNFENGVIQNMGIGSIGSIGSVGAIVSGQNNQVTAAAGSAKVNSTETIHNTFIDYSRVLPAVGQWKQHYRNHAQNEVADRFEELEALMKSGTPNDKSRLRLRDLLTDLTTWLGATKEVLGFFDIIRKLAGF